MIKFQPLAKNEIHRLRGSLLKNGGSDNFAVLMGADTSYAGESTDLPRDAEVINAIRSVPTHYAK